MSYTVKLYGHLSDNPERFHQQLADLLGIDVEHATALVRDVPVIVRQGLPKEQAERMAAGLGVIRALCLIESEGNEPEPEEPAKPLSTAFAEEMTEPEEEENLRPGRMWLGILLGGVALILIVASVSFFSMFRKTYSENRDTPSPPKVQSAAETDSAKEPLSELQFKERIASLEEKIELIRAQIKQTEDDEAWARNGSGMDLEQMQKYRQDRANLHGEISTHVREIKQLKAQLHGMEVRSGAQTGAGQNR
ncbi:MAG: hypothetical protein HY914_19440 [Desulfomonile tiedjei]|nr:hypothetical protein [Desulfomonile tiedjei]